MKMTLFFSVAVTLVLGASQAVFGHCEVPCGIYGDAMRFEMINEHITTVEKSMRQIVDLSRSGDNYNQLVRWINNKDEHAEKIQWIVQQYFLTQRVQPVERSQGEEYLKYQREVELLHRMLVAAMKAKQTTDLGFVDQLRHLAGDFRESYMGPGDSHHH